MKCHTCNSETHADVTSFGGFLTAGYHSRHDTNRYVWLHPEYRPEGNPDYCDNCIDQMIEDRKIEFVCSVMGVQPNQRLSAEALREIFADEAQATFRDLQSTFPDWTPAQTKGDDWHQTLVKLRNLITRDETFKTTRSFTFPFSSNDNLTASQIGHAHAVAAGTLGLVDWDPDFRHAATTWARARVDFRSQIDQIERDFLSLL